MTEKAPRIRSMGTAVPEQCFSQEEIYTRFLEPFLGQNPRAGEIFRNTGVGFRHLVVDGSYYAKERSTRDRNERYLEEAIPLGVEAIQNCLDRAGLEVGEVDDLIVVSCTGLDIPGLDLRLAGEMGMRANLQRECVLGMGCYAAFPALRRARDAVFARPGRKALVLALELCSLHFQQDDDSMDNIVSSGLFADGAAAVLVESPLPDEAPRGPALLDFATRCDYQTFEHMAFHLTDTGFQMRLTAYVPKLLSVEVEAFADELLEKNGLSREDISHWGVHPGSSKILDYTAERLGIQDDGLESSRWVLHRYGNMSSPTVLFVLDELEKKRPAPGEYGVLMAFGPGLTLESALVRW